MAEPVGLLTDSVLLFCPWSQVSEPTAPRTQCPSCEGPGARAATGGLRAVHLGLPVLFSAVQRPPLGCCHNKSAEVSPSRALFVRKDIGKAPRTVLYKNRETPLGLLHGGVDGSCTWHSRCFRDGAALHLSTT